IKGGRILAEGSPDELKRQIRIGDVVALRLDPAAPAGLADLAGVLQVQARGDRIDCTVDSAEKRLSEILRWLAEPIATGAAEWWMEEWVRLSAFAYRNLIMARRNVFFLFELTFWPVVAMVSHGLPPPFLDLTPQMTAFILVGTIALSAVQVCQLDVAYAVLFDIWSKSMKHQFLTPVRIHHLALGSWLVGVGRGVTVWALMAVIGGRAFGFDFLGAGAARVALFLLGCFLTALVIGLLV